MLPTGYKFIPFSAVKEKDITETLKINVESLLCYKKFNFFDICKQIFLKENYSYMYSSFSEHNQNAWIRLEE